MANARPIGPTLEDFCRDVGRAPLLTAEQEKRLARAIREGGPRLRALARDLLIRSNIRLVFGTAKHFTGRGLDLPDLVQEGAIGLITAAERYDPARGTRFSTFATHWIRQPIRYAVADKSRLIRVPGYQQTVARTWDKIAQALYLETGAPAREAELLPRVQAAVRNQKGMKKVNPFMLRTGRRFLYARPLEINDGLELVESRREQSVSDQAAFSEQLRDTLEALSELTKQERTVIRLRFGLDGKGPRTLRQIGEKLGYTRERIRQIEQAALEKLRVALGQS